MKLGVLINLHDKTESIDHKFETVKNYGFDSCQLCCWDMSCYTDEIADEVNAACKAHGVTISTFWAGWSGPIKWNFYDGPCTLGLVPSSYRDVRIRELKAGSDFAKKLGVKNVATHMGYLPENPCTEQYHEVVCAIRSVAEKCKENDQYLLFETGQETPVTLRRTIEDVGTDNLGINLDPANLILYGKANPVDALDVFGEYVRDVHAKDGCYPTNGRNLGKEMPLGEGKVNFPALVKRLKEVGYDGPLTIEREISGEEQARDIKKAKELLEELI